MPNTMLHAMQAQLLYTDESVELPIIMYHFLSNKNNSKWATNVDLFEEDLKYVKENGYTTVNMADVIDYVYHGVPLPEKPIMLTFDDGDSSMHHTLLPLLEKYELKVVVSIIGAPTEEYSKQNRTDIRYYPNITWPQIKDLMDSGFVEIQNHSYNLHHDQGAKRKKDESEDQYAERFSKDINQLQALIEEHTGTIPTTFVYPFGGYSNISDEVLAKNGFKASLICEEHTNIIRYGDEECLFGLYRYLRPNHLSSQSFFEKF